MKKLKILLLALAATISVGAWAETDVTNLLNDAAIASEANWGGGHSSGGNHSRNAAGYWESWHNTFTLTQTINGLDAGYYMVSIQGVVEGGSTTAAVLTATSGSNTASAYLRNNTRGNFDENAAALKASPNLHRSYATVKVEDGKLTVSFKQTATDQWIVYGQFKLHKLTEEEGANQQTLETALSGKSWGVNGSTGPYHGLNERYYDKDVGGGQSGDVIYNSFTNMPKGIYEVSVTAAASYTSNRGFEGKTGDGLTVFRANGVDVNVPVYDRGAVDYSAYTTYTAKCSVGDDGELKFGLYNLEEKAGNWFIYGVNNITYFGDLATALATARSKAKAIIDAEPKMNSTVWNNLNTEYTNSENVSEDQMNDAIESLDNAIDNAKVSIADYAKLKAAIDLAKKYTVIDETYETLATTITTAEGIYNNGTVETCAETIADLDEAVKAAKVADYTYVSKNYAHPVNLGTWKEEGQTGKMKGQHWSGDDKREYLEQSSDAWGWNSWSLSYNQDVTLPAGNYVFKVAGRKAVGDGCTLSLVVKNGEDIIGSISNFPEGDTGLGINKVGATSFDSGDTNGFANNNNGRGFQWRYVKFTLTGDAKVNVAVKANATTSHQWVSFCDATIQTDNEANLAMIAYNIALNDAKLAKENDAYKNVTGAELTELNTAMAFETADKTKTEIEEATIALQNATSAFKAAAPAYDNYKAVLAKVENLDDAGKAKFNELAADINRKYGEGTIWAADLANVTDFYIAAVKAQTTIDSDWSALGGTDRSAWVGATGNYATNYVEKYAGHDVAFEAGNVLTQTIEGLMPYAKYEVKFTAVASHARGLTDDAHGNGIAQVFANDNAIDIEVLYQEACDPTDSKYQYTLEGYVNEDGKLTFGLKNVREGGQWYVAQFTSLILKALPSSFDATLTKIGDAAYSSMYLDFPVEIPEGVEAYYVTVEGKTATMNEIEGVIPANCGVILKAANAGTVTFTQTSTTATTDVSDNVLIGFVEDTEVDNGKAHYAFSYKENKVAFYIPASAEVGTDPTSKFTAKAHKAYIELESAPNAKLDIAWGGEATGINTIDNGQLTVDNSKAYNLNGIRVNPSTGSGQAYKGIVLKGGKKFLQK